MLLNAGYKWAFLKGGKGSIVDFTFVSPCLVLDNNAWAVTNTFYLSDYRLIYWEVSTDRANRVRPAERTKALGWKASASDSGLFGVALEKRPINVKDATEEVEEVMKRITKACDSNIPESAMGTGICLFYWWRDTIVVLRREGI